MTAVSGERELPEGLNLPPTAVIETWNTVESMGIRLADIIGDDIIATGKDYDLAIVVTRGGMGPGNITLRRLGFESPAIFAVALSSYADGEVTGERQLLLGQVPDAEVLEGRRVLILDEVCESGDSLDFLTQLLELAQVEEYKVGVFHFKPEKAAQSSGFKPDFYLEQTEKWVHYPWEIHDYEGNRFRLRKELVGIKAANRATGQVVRVKKLHDNQI